MTVTDAGPKKIRTSRRDASRRSPPLPSSDGRLIKLEMQVSEVLKSGGSQPPRTLTLNLLRAYIKPSEIKPHIEAMRAQVINRPQIYLVSTPECVEVVGVEEKGRILAILGKGLVKTKSPIKPQAMVIVPESSMPVQALPRKGGRWLN